MTHPAKTLATPWFTDAMAQQLAQARDLHAQAQQLLEQSDALVDAFAKHVMQQLMLTEPAHKANIAALIDELPAGGFHRTELRAAFIRKFFVPGTDAGAGAASGV